MVYDLKIGILAVQGAFSEHSKKLSNLGVLCIEIRKKSDLDNNTFDALVLPGGESTTQAKLICDFDMKDQLKQLIEQGVPVLATCAGMILLAQEIVGQGPGCLGTIPMTIQRNAYGRQLDSFHTVAEFETLGAIPMTFIRAPYVEQVGTDVEILSVVQEHIVAVQYGNQIALSFHPELDDSDTVLQLFLAMITRRKDISVK